MGCAHSLSPTAILTTKAAMTYTATSTAEIASTAPMDRVVLEAIDQSVRQTFNAMLNREVQQIEAGTLLRTLRSTAGDPAVVSVVMGWSGEISGSLTLTLDEASALDWTGVLTGQRYDEIDSDVIDAIGEMANLIIGGAKSRLGDYGIQMTLPIVIQAGLGCMGLPTAGLNLRMVYAAGPCRVVVLASILN